MLSETSGLFQTLKSVENLGRDIYRDVTLQAFKFTLAPIGSGDETLSYMWAEKMSQREVGEGQAPPAFQISPSYVVYVKQHIVSQAIYAINGVKVDRGETVADLAGRPQEVGEYLRALVMTWPSEVIDYLFMEYNKLQIEVGKQYGFTLAHREALNALDRIIQIGASLQEQLKGQIKNVREEAVPVEDDPVEDTAPASEPVQEPEDRAQSGVLDQGDVGSQDPIRP